MNYESGEVETESSRLDGFFSLEIVIKCIRVIVEWFEYIIYNLYGIV